MINTTYNYLPVSLPNNKTVKYHSHKKSELRSIYNHIINLSRKSPIYILNMTNTNRYYALAIKQNAMELNEVMQQMEDDTKNSLLDSKVAISSDPDILNAHLVTSSITDLPSPLILKVRQLATPQVNLGKEFSYDTKSLKPGAYRFAINIKDNSYEFQYNALVNSTSKDNQLKLVDFMNQANIGITASFETSPKGEAGRIRLESTETGTDGNLIFTLEDRQSDSLSRIGIVDTFQLNTLTNIPKNAVFILNGEEQSSMSNSFCLNKSLNITLKSTSEYPVHIDYTAKKDDVLGEINRIVEGYNDMIHLGNEFSKDQLGARKLIYDLNHLARNYKSELESCGLNLLDNNELSVDESLVLQAADDGDLKKLLSNSLGFVSSVIHKTSDITINPMQYLDKTIVYYKNHSKQVFSNPYMTSIYSGMIFNSYC